MRKTRDAVVIAVTAASIAALALWAPFAQAAPPPNDDFGNREMLNGPLPIDTMRANEEATKESGESLGFLAAAGHSVWFEWEALNTGWVTIGACQSDFPETLGVFQGTAVNSLTKVVSGNRNEGPNCPFRQRDYTFKAQAGTKYEIAVDGDGFYLETPPATTEGSFSLRIEATPAPPNDDFADATTLTAPVEEEPDGSRFYWAIANGYTWGARDETSEPEHAEDPGGASVWYEWTPPESGVARIGVNLCCQTLLGFYTGTSVSSLTPVTPIATFPGNVEALVTGGTHYRIAVDGSEEGSSGEPAMFAFQLYAMMTLADGPGEGGGPAPKQQQPPAPAPGDVTAPQTKILERSVKPGKRQATFNFTSSEAGGGFRCQLDSHPLGACNPPKSYSRLAYGKHVFRVAAVDSAGNTDPSAALARFTIPKPKARHRNAH